MVPSIHLHSASISAAHKRPRLFFRVSGAATAGVPAHATRLPAKRWTSSGSSAAAWVKRKCRCLERFVRGLEPFSPRSREAHRARARAAGATGPAAKGVRDDQAPAEIRKIVQGRPGSPGVGQRGPRLWFPSVSDVLLMRQHGIPCVAVITAFPGGADSPLGGLMRVATPP